MSTSKAIGSNTIVCRYTDLKVKYLDSEMYVGQSDDGEVLLVDRSSNGQKPIKYKGKRVTTSIFVVGCKGAFWVQIKDVIYVWREIPNTWGVLKAEERVGDEEFKLWDLTIFRTLSKRLNESSVNKRAVDDDESTKGAQPRCPNSPPGLVAKVIDEDREMKYKGCSRKWWSKKLVPEDLFKDACDERDDCYGIVPWNHHHLQLGMS